MKKVLATALVLCSLFYILQAKAASSLAHETPIVNVRLCQIFMKEYSRPLIDSVRISVPEAKQLGYFFETKKDRVILNQYNGTAGLFKFDRVILNQYNGTAGLFKFPHYNDFKLAWSDVVPFGVVVLDDADWEQFRRINFSADADNCLDCALYKKTKDVYKLKDHLVNLRAFASMLGTLNVRDNYAIKLSAFNKLMQTNKKLASTVEKAKANGFRLCPVVPDDYAGMNLDSYVDIVQVHLHAVEEKMKEALK